jgi:hypothetical protein
MAIAVYYGSTYLVHRALIVSPTKTEPKPQLPTADESKFRSALEAGGKAFQAGQYAEALDQYLKAEHAGEVLSDRQNEELKSARLQLAQIYVNFGNRSDADGVYRAAADGAVHQAQAFFLAKQYEQSLARAQDGEQFANLLNENKLQSLRAAIYVSVNALTGLERYPEAQQTEERLIDYLKRTADDYDKGFSDEYMNLGYNRSEAHDWQGSAEALASAVDAADRTLDHYSPSRDHYDQTIYNAALLNKNWSEYNLVIGLYRAGSVDASLAKADELYNEWSSLPQDAMHPLNVPYRSWDIASLGYEIATESKNQSAADHWARLGGGPIKVIALRPASRRGP